MLERILEPEVMDTDEEARDYDTMDHGHVNRVFVADLLTAFPDLETADAEILDLGTGTAQIPIELCRQTNRLRVRAADAAAAMLVIAKENVAAASFISRIELALVDAKRLPFGDGSFAAVMSNSIVHHIPEPRTAIAEAARVTRTGGTIFFRDLLRPDNLSTLDALVRTYAAGANEHQQRMFAESLHAALNLEEMRSLVAEFGFSRDSVRATSDRHWTWSARKH